MTNFYKVAPGVLLFLVLSFFSFGTPDLIENEPVYLLMGHQLADPEFIANDWSMGDQAGRTHGLLFSYIVAPLWAIDLNPFQIALTIRAVQTLFMLFCAMWFLRSLNVPLLPGLLGLSVWVIAGQLAIAGEWVLGGAEQKPFAYGFVLLALGAAFKARWLAMSVFLSIATSLHILVGAWAAIVLFSSALLTARFKNFWTLVGAGLLALVIISPAVYLALVESLHQAGNFSPIPPYESIAELTMKFRVPHHLDPSYFLTPRNVFGHVIAVSCLVASIWFAGFNTQAQRILAFTVTGLLIAVGLGLADNSLELYALTTLYPFRVADGLLPLLAFLLTPYLLARTKEWATLDSNLLKLSIAGSIAAVFILAIVRYDTVTRKFERTTSDWQIQLSGEYDERRAVYHWIRENTAPDATFVAPPWWHDFRLVAERPVYVMLKSVPNNDMVWEWYRRLMVTNGGREFENSGYRLIPELREGFQSISQGTLESIASSQQAEFYISPMPRTDLSFAAAHQEGNSVIYDIRTTVSREKHHNSSPDNMLTTSSD